MLCMAFTSTHIYCMPKFKTLTKSQIEEIPKLAESLTTNQIADYFRICRTTFYEMRKSNPVIAEHYRQGRAKVIAQIAGSLITNQNIIGFCLQL